MGFNLRSAIQASAWNLIQGRWLQNSPKEFFLLLFFLK